MGKVVDAVVAQVSHFALKFERIVPEVGIT